MERVLAKGGQSQQRKGVYVLWALLRGMYPNSDNEEWFRWLSCPSLLLLSDFHPRSMHFPPGDDNDDILAPAEESIKNLYSNGHETQDMQPGGESTFAGWTEPALRSDRMSWSLIGLSHALAYELGIFGSFSEGSRSPDGRFKRQGGSPAYYKRADRIERLLYIYITQACGRFGFPSMYPDRMNKFNLSSINEGYRSGKSFNHEC